MGTGALPGVKIALARAVVRARVLGRTGARGANRGRA